MIPRRLGLSSAILLLFTLVLAVPVASAKGPVIDIKSGAASNQGDPGYAPAVITVVIGVNDTVTWTNGDSSPHTVTGDNGTTVKSGNMNAGESYSVTFTSPGTYPFHCDYHSWMKGTVKVKAQAIPEFPVSTLAIVLLVAIAAVAVASGRLRTAVRTPARMQ